jgi:dienelactone hydrolase
MPPVNALPSLDLIEIQAESMILRGILQIPPGAKSIVVFAHGIDSSNLSPRNRLVARILLQRGFAVLLPDLTDDDDDNDCTPAPASDREEIQRTAVRLTAVIDWLAANPATGGLRIGLFGGRTGAAAAMIAAALRPEQVHAVISRGGRPDLAEELLGEVKAPTLMIVGSNDRAHLDHNREAGEKMNGRPMLEVVIGASHLFGEPGKIEQVASISYQWFHRNLAMCG